eukprot:GAHX01003661.1.p1 GENE.GAHX01003661.1~~GAHX01003661.1.p1  ORF type:complete len:277 (-),score=36.67 GAHX01003661.1:386-1216(-)
MSTNNRQHPMNDIPNFLDKYKTTEQDEDNRINIANDQIQPFLHEIHQFLGHPGISKTKQTLRPFFTFINFNDNIEVHVNSCLPCLKNKHHKTRKGTLQGYMMADKPWENVSSDIFGPIELESYQSDGKAYLITFSDLFTRFSIVRLIRNPNAEETVKIFNEEWVLKYGAPAKLITDNGSNYGSAHLETFCNERQIDHRFSSPYNPTGNSISERINQSLGNILRIERGSDIQAVIQRIETNLNATVNRTTGYSAEQLAFNKSVLNYDKEETIDLNEV